MISPSAWCAAGAACSRSRSCAQSTQHGQPDRLEHDDRQPRSQHDPDRPPKATTASRTAAGPQIGAGASKTAFHQPAAALSATQISIRSLTIDGITRPRKSSASTPAPRYNPQGRRHRQAAFIPLPWPPIVGGMRRICRDSAGVLVTVLERSVTWNLFDPAGHRLYYLAADERAAFLEAAKSAPREVRTFCHVLHDTGCPAVRSARTAHARGGFGGQGDRARNPQEAPPRGLPGRCRCAPSSWNSST